MRHASPLLVTGRLFEGNRDGLRDEVVSRGRGEIIPEETGEFMFPKCSLSCSLN